ncbi:hypothetical protein B0H15DRAFT_802279 [Mycena belliarum]|uniref:Uncharacterized protein n=1 Tax=Mycena belliarum TaxID=1033014 RepID=A0AAD6XQ53_9AGAR|nr:hypothetical protein B0H15DRAFT_802279 [Mycena belliae]
MATTPSNIVNSPNATAEAQAVCNPTSDDMLLPTEFPSSESGAQRPSQIGTWEVLLHRIFIPPIMERETSRPQPYNLARQVADATCQPKKTLDRAERGLCRILTHCHGITRIDIARHCGWSAKIVGRMARNDILPGDTVADDENEVGARPDLLVIMQELITKRSSEMTKATSKKASQPSTAVHGRSTRVRTLILLRAPPRHKFLEKFIKGSAMDPIYYDLFVAASVTEEGLRRMMHLPEAFIENFFASLVPEATKFDRVLFVTAICWVSDGSAGPPHAGKIVD